MEDIRTHFFKYKTGVIKLFCLLLSTKEDAEVKRIVVPQKRFHFTLCTDFFIKLRIKSLRQQPLAKIRWVNNSLCRIMKKLHCLSFLSRIDLAFHGRETHIYSDLEESNECDKATTEASSTKWSAICPPFMKCSSTRGIIQSVKNGAYQSD